jgi:hypothetical protein
MKSAKNAWTRSKYVSASRAVRSPAVVDLEVIGGVGPPGPAWRSAVAPSAGTGMARRCSSTSGRGDIGDMQRAGLGDPVGPFDTKSPSQVPDAKRQAHNTTGKPSATSGNLRAQVRGLFRMQEGSGTRTICRQAMSLSRPNHESVTEIQKVSFRDVFPNESGSSIGTRNTTIRVSRSKLLRLG